MRVSLRGPKERTELGGLQSGLPDQHCGTDLYQQRPRVTASRPARRVRGPGARPNSVPHRQPGPQPDLSSPVDVHTASYVESMGARCLIFSSRHYKQKRELLTAGL